MRDQVYPILGVILFLAGTVTGAVHAEHRNQACDAAWHLGEACSCSERHTDYAYHGVSTDPGHPSKPCLTMPGDRDRGDCPPYRYRMNDEARAGCPERVAPWAICGRPTTRFGRYSAWFVGGGAAYAKLPQPPVSLFSRGRDRHANGCGQAGEGTWGQDYQGMFHKANVWLKYTSNRNQGGEGTYETDGGPEIIDKVCHLLKPEH